MRVIVMIMFLYICIIAGCAKKEDNKYVGIDEKTVTNEINDISQQPTEKPIEDEYSIDKENVKLYIDDSHFYDNDEGINFAMENEKEEKCHIRILDAYTSDNLNSFGNYFDNNIITEEIEE